ncbi:MAG: hypothetical protein ACI976_001336 [Aureispira sp.]|jgi:hypothetical protein
MEIEEYQNNESPPEKWKSVLSLIAIVILGLVLFRILFALLVPIVSVILLVANRDLVSKIVRAIYNLYQDEVYKGLLATLASIFLFAPFVVFLFFRTVYYMFAENKIEEEPSTDRSEANLINIVLKEKAKSMLNDDDNTGYR